MARPTNIALQIKKFSRIKVCVVWLRYFLYFYAFISFVFWLLNCFEVDWLYIFNPVFKGPIIFVRKVLNYSPQGVGVDFSLAIIGGISLMLGFILNSISDKIQSKLYDLEDEEERLILKIRERNRKTPFKTTSAPADGIPMVDAVASPNIEVENPKLLFLIAPQVKRIKRRQDDLDLTIKEVQYWKQRINKTLLEHFSPSKPMQKGYYRKNLFLLYNDFNYVEDLVYHAKPTLAQIITEFKKYGVIVSFCTVLSSISSVAANLEKELDLMDIVLSLKFHNEIMLTQRFKIAYDNKDIQQYSMKFKGEYNLSKNLTITNRQPLYKLEEKN